MPALEGLHTEQVACGVGFTLFLVDAPEERLAKMPLWTAETVDPLVVAAPLDDEEGGGKKRKGEPAASKAKKAK